MHQTVPSVLQQELVDLSLTFRASASRRVQSECYSSSSERVLLVEFRASASRRVQSECFSSSSERVLLVEFRASASRRVQSECFSSSFSCLVSKLCNTIKFKEKHTKEWTGAVLPNGIPSS